MLELLSMAGTGQTGRKTFTYREARELLPAVRTITEEVVRRAEVVAGQIEGLEEDDPERAICQEMYHRLLDEWAQRVMALGCEVKGAWLVDFDNGEGYFCWQYPEVELAYFHSYESGFTGRQPIQ